LNREITYADALREAQEYCLGAYSDVVVMGLGVPDPKGIFGSTLGLADKFGHDRVFDIPLSENAITGVALGSAITGLRPILTHQRVEFAIAGIEPLVNQIAKWCYMFDGKMSAPLVIRIVIGRGWGQGPQHSQSLQSWFAHIPGLKVIMPTTPYDAKGMLIAAVEDNNPVICMEHRWLYDIKGHVPYESYREEIDKAKVVREGVDITLVGTSYMALECLKASTYLDRLDICAEVIDLRSIKPLDIECIVRSVKKTGLLVIVDNAHRTAGIASEISARVTEEMFSKLKLAPQRITFPEHPTPTSVSLADHYYALPHDIARKCLHMLGMGTHVEEALNDRKWRDQPNPEFHGPF